MAAQNYDNFKQDLIASVVQRELEFQASSTRSHQSWLFRRTGRNRRVLVPELKKDLLSRLAQPDTRIGVTVH